MEDISDADYNQAKKLSKDFELKIRGDCHDLYLQSDMSLLQGIFECFLKKCTETHESDPDCFLLPAGLSWKALLKRLN